MRKSIFTLFALVFALPAEAQERFFRPDIQAKDIEPTLRTDWFGVYLEDKKIGYFMTHRKREGDLIVDTVAVRLKVVSFKQKGEMNAMETLVFQGTAPYRLLRGELNMTGLANLNVTVRRTDKGFEYQLAIAGQKQTKDVADFDYTLADVMAGETWLRSYAKIGDAVQVRQLDLQEWKLERNKHKFVATKNSLVSGVDVKYYEVESANSKIDLPFLSRHDADGKLLSGRFAIFEQRRETEEQAKNTEYSQDLFVLGMAKLDKGIGRTTNVVDLVLEIGGKAVDVFEPGPRQSLAAGTGGTKLLKTGKAHGKEAKASAKDIEDNLAETNAYAINHPKVKALAKEAAGDAKTPEEKLARIVAFVHGFVQPNLSASLPNIHDLMEKKKGDCKSYALLTTNLCRAAGIPAREVAGLLYMGDDQKAFGGHAWNEVILNGVWIPVDASLGQTEVDAGHLCFGAEQRATKNLLNSLGKLSFKVVEVKTK